MKKSGPSHAEWEKIGRVIEMSKQRRDNRRNSQAEKVEREQR
jgi:hypothetical protein